MDKALGGAIGELIDGGEFEGKLNQIAVIRTRGAIPLKRVLLIGLCERAEFNLDRMRQTSSKAAIHIREMGLKEFITGIHDLPKFKRLTTAQAVVTSSLMGLYQFTKYITVKREEMKEVELEGIPLHRYGYGKDMAGAAMWLATPSGEYVTGQLINVNGGLDFT